MGAENIRPTLTADDVKTLRRHGGIVRDDSGEPCIVNPNEVCTLPGTPPGTLEAHKLTMKLAKQCPWLNLKRNGPRVTPLPQRDHDYGDNYSELFVTYPDGRSPEWIPGDELTIEPSLEIVTIPRRGKRTIKCIAVTAELHAPSPDTMTFEQLARLKKQGGACLHFNRRAFIYPQSTGTTSCLYIKYMDTEAPMLWAHKTALRLTHPAMDIDRVAGGWWDQYMKSTGWKKLPQVRRIKDLLTDGLIRVGSYVRAAEGKGFFSKSRVKDEWGEVTEIDNINKRVKVRWSGGSHDWTSCGVSEYATIDPDYRPRDLFRIFP